MKYVMFETAEGQKLPVLFPECLTHSIMAMFMRGGIECCIKKDADPVSAGFVNVGTNIEVWGKSESMGNLESNPADAARIVLGGSIEFMPDAMASAMASAMMERLKEQKA